MLTYADLDDLATWTGADAPANADQLLRSATVVVAAATGRNPYTDDTPTGTNATVLRDATTAQAAVWIALSLDPTTAGLTSGSVKRSKIGTGDVEYDTTGQAEARAQAANELAPEARKILLTAGLLLVDLPVWTGDTDRLLDYGLAGTWPTVVPDPTTT